MIHGKGVSAAMGWCRCATLMMLVLLTGCVMSPGLDMKTGDALDDWESLENGETPVQVIPITGELLARQLARDQQRGMPAREAPRARKTGSSVPTEYRVSPHDVLQITVWNHPELTNPSGALGMGGSFQAAAGAPSGRLVRGDGTIFYPYVGVIHVAGRTVEEIREMLADRLKGYIESPQVDVRVARFRGQRVYVTGEVLKPGIYAIGDQGMTVLDAINQAGGVSISARAGNAASLAFTPDLAHVTVMRDGRLIHVNLRALLKDGDVSQNIPLRAGDIVHVPSNYRNKVFVLGEVRNQGALVMAEGRMSLTEAISEAGGFDQATSNPARVFVIRGQRPGKGERLKKPLVYRLNAESPDAILLADQFELRPRDIVFVSTASVVRWGRVLNQLSGTIQAINLGIAAGRGRRF